MPELLEDLVEWLVQEHLVEGDGIDTFRDYIPDSPENLVALIEYDSILPSIRVKRTAVRYVQINVRNLSNDAAKRKCYDIFHLFDSSDEAIIELPSGRWAIMIPKQLPFKVSTDDNGLTTWAFNVAITTNSD